MSSAYRLIDSTNFKQNKVGPSTEPWGIPHAMLALLKKESLIFLLFEVDFVVWICTHLVADVLKL